MNNLTFIPFQPKYAKTFKNLNLEWIKKFFVVENKDIELLDNCEENIINKGGYIFFAKIDTTIVGCVAYIKIEDNVYELGKMAISEAYQGKKIGQELLTFAINFAKEKQWKQVILYSSVKLTNALHIYKKVGFKEVPLEPNVVYKRSSIKMELNLK
ncbi:MULTISPECIES: GNAT family N-acetyltransferase [Cellulophaga]|uniref:GCN5-related N-acetyltransferase n=2 Tax=Cellulophaga TaxID=104264 RepID=F0RAF9_CELLC|nr:MULTISPECIES: GNAT family N-acetyltransferase [Cellulophaga]ADY30522.1 GCN5-related N-acetyltransferase [Cellulophaga lytica DSM 7489]AIM61512.1 GNAT family acetyltransferase [Cellulophaga lytica]APU11405.1 GNAT family acetyltransferase [Cellulophaga lytica]EWH13957.1 N-acetyltransferase GCN5 [Cellulophaga geojensis KL-A]MDO6853227.1 GNAT family N-acetyltransferase [Cellulophaga lytica]